MYSEKRERDCVAAEDGKIMKLRKLINRILRFFRKKIIRPKKPKIIFMGEW